MTIETAPQDETITLDEDQAVTEELEGGNDTRADPPAEEPEELVISLDGEEQEPEEESVPWVRQLRKERREDKRKLREYEQRLAEMQTRSSPAADVEAPGAKPTLEGCDFDGEVFAQRLDEWHEKNTKHQAKQAEVTRKQEAERESWNRKLQTYAAEKSALKVPDYEDAEENVLGSLNVTQQGLLLKAKDPAKLVYALGKSPKKLAELAGISDPVDFVYAVAEVQGKIQVQKRTPPPVVDRPVRGATSGVSVADQQLDKLREQARKTGDYSAYFAAKNSRKG